MSHERSEGQIVERRQLDNGMEFVLHDRSRLLAGDRWLVALYCETIIPIDNSYWKSLPGEDSQLLPAIRKVMGDHLVLTITKKRNFVDAQERESILQEMVRQIQSTILGYLIRPDFPLHLFGKKYRDARQKVLLQQAMMNHAEKLSSEGQ